MFNKLLLNEDEFVYEDVRITLDSSDVSEVRINDTTISSPKWKNGVTLEPMLFLHGTALYFCSVNVQSFFIDSTCRQKFNPVNSSICANLSAYKAEGALVLFSGVRIIIILCLRSLPEGMVEESVAFYLSVNKLIEAGLPIFMALFLGAWSDKFGSKAPMVLALCGHMCSALLLTFLSLMANATPAMLLIASVPIAFSGGLIGLIISVCRYISEISAVENRSFRFALIGGIWSLGTPIGLMGSAEIVKHFGYTIVFLIASFLYFLSILYTVIIIRNDKGTASEPLVSGHSNACSDIFNLSAVTDTFETCFKRRERNHRMYIGILFFNFSLITLAYGGYSIQFLYTKLTLTWDAEKFSLYSTFDGITGSLGSTFATVILVNYFSIQDNVITLLGTISYLIANSTFMIASTTWMMYLGSIAQVICTLAGVNIRSLLSKLVADKEHGKIFAFLACFESAMPLLGNFLYNYVFEEAVNSSFPELVYMLSVCLYSITLISFLLLWFLMRHSSTHHTPLDEHD